jgi:hypothetical protein
LGASRLYAKTITQSNTKHKGKIPLNVLPAVRYWFYLLRPSRDFRILYVPHAGLRQHKLFEKNIENPTFSTKNAKIPPKINKINHILAHRGGFTQNPPKCAACGSELFYLLRPLQDCVTLNEPLAGLQQHKLVAKNIENCSIFDKKTKKTPKIPNYLISNSLILSYP